MDPTQASARGRFPEGKASAIQPSLHRDVGACFELQVPPVLVPAVVFAHRALDVDRVSRVAFDQVRVVAVHRPNQIGQRPDDSIRQAAPQPRPRGGQLERDIVQGRSRVGA
jgi:hypothetical protein